MKKIFILLCLCVMSQLFLARCSSDKATNNPVSDPGTSDPIVNNDGIDYRQEMRKFVGELASYARQKDANFIMIPQNGPELLTNSGNADNTINQDYLNVIDGIGNEDLYYGADFKDDQATELTNTNYHLPYLDLYKNNSKKVLITDYCWTIANVDNSFQKNLAQGYISFAAPSRGLELIPTYPNPIFNENNSNITTLAEAKNFLYVINTYGYNTLEEFLAAIRATNYDALIIDLFWDPDSRTPVMLTQSQITSLKTKANGGKRLVICYISIGEAEDYRWYWDDSWTDATGKLTSSAPIWMEPVNPNWEGNYTVEYWNQDWKNIIFGNSDAYLDRILAVGCDGIYMDIIDAFFYFEEKSN